MGRASAEGGLALLLVWGLCLVFWKKVPAVRCWVWRVGYLKIVVAMVGVGVTLAVLPAEKKEPLQGAAKVEAMLMVAGSKDEVPLVAPGAPAMKDEAARVAVATPKKNADGPAVVPVGRAVPAQRNWDWVKIGVVMWAAGVAVGLAWVGWGYRRVKKLARGGRRVERTVCNQMAARMGVRAIAVVEVDGAGPLVTGIWRPVVVLPAGVTYSEDQLRLVVAHELAHVKRWDLGWNLLMGVVELLMWFHPMLWIGRRERGRLQEEACDARAMAALDAGAEAYGGALLEVVGKMRGMRSAAGAVAIGNSARNLKRRMLAMKTYSSGAKRAWVAAIVVAAMALVGVPQWRLVARGQYVPPAPAGGAGDNPAKVQAPAPAGAVAEGQVKKVVQIRYFQDFNNVKGAEGVEKQLEFLGYIGGKVTVSADQGAGKLTIVGTEADVRAIAEIVGRWEYEAAQGRNAQAAGGWGPGFVPAGGVAPGMGDAVAKPPEPIKPADMPAAVEEFYGNLSARVVQIQSPVDGAVAELVAKEGQKVKKGDVLVKLDDRAARAAVELAELKVEANVPTATRGGDALEMAAAKIQLQTAMNALDDLTIRSPMDGALQVFSAVPGQLVTRGTGLTAVVAVDDVEVVFYVPGLYMPRFEVGQKFTVKPEGELPVTGVITYIAPTAEMLPSPRGGGSRPQSMVKGKLMAGGGGKVERLRSGMKVSVYVAPGKE